MTTRARASSWVAGLAAGMLSLLAHASFVWQVDGQVPTRIDITTAAAQSAAEPGPVDAIVPLPDGGAWLRRGSELIRLTPDLRVAARANVALAGPMHWESQSRRLWVLAGRDLLRYDEHLLLDGAVRFDVELRGLAASGPDAIWVATDTRLMRFQRDGGQVDAIELSSMALGGTVAGVLADTPSARVWVVATSGEMVAIDVAEDLRHAGLRRALSRDALAVTVDAASGVIHQFAREPGAPCSSSRAPQRRRKSLPRESGSRSAYCDSWRALRPSRCLPLPCRSSSSTHAPTFGRIGCRRTPSRCPLTWRKSGRRLPGFAWPWN